MRDFLSSTWFSIGELSFTYGQILASLAFVIVGMMLYWYLANRLLRKYLAEKRASPREASILTRYSFYLAMLAVVIVVLLILDLNRTLIATELININISDVLGAIFIVLFARALDLIFSQMLVNRVYDRRDRLKEVAERATPTKERAGKTAQYIVYLIAVILVLTTFDIDFKLFDLPASTKGDEVIPIRISNVLTAVLVLVSARLFTWILTEVILYQYYQRAKVNVGSQYAFNQLLKYVLFTIAILMAINQLGVNTTILLGGLAALLVGIGLGLQQTFNDFFSGVILLFERSVELGDVLEVDGMVGSVKKIGMRASHIETRENITVVVPNSKLVSQNVINWSHFDDKVRFIIPVPIPYGSNATVVRSVLLQAAKDSQYVLTSPAPFVRLYNFADSSLLFELHFWSRHFIIIEDVKSDLRIMIADMLEKEGIHIPFPQLDVWMRTKEDQ